MHSTFFIIPLAILASTGCSAHRNSGSSQSFPVNNSRPSTVPAPATPPVTTGTIVTPARPKSGHVTLVNGSARYVVVTFSLGQLPAHESHLAVYRNGLKVAELKVTGFSRDINAVADIVMGECEVGDEVREN